MSAKRLSIVVAVALIALSSPPATAAAMGFATDSVVLYQPDSFLSERVPRVEDLAGYIKRLRGVCAAFFATADTPETLHIVVALKPGRQSRVWFVSSSPAKQEREPLRRQLEAVDPVEIHNGPVVFAISAKIAGGSGKASGPDGDGQPPIPREWQDAAKGHKGSLAVPDGFLELVWPDA